jgi:2,3,4,5-tetrahydropyridine-2-carboxylate N-succinyltransferase
VWQSSRSGDWLTHEWIKKAVLLYFPIQAMETIEVGPFEYHDKIPLKTGILPKKVCAWCRQRWRATVRSLKKARS